MKKLMMAAMVAVTMSFDVSAETITVDGVEFNYKIVGNGITITKGDYTPAIPRATSGAIVVPETIAGRKVTSIGNFAFFNCNALTDVKIPSGVTSLGFDAFYGCTGLTRIKLPEGLVTIGSEAFRGCSSLRFVVIPKSVTKLENGLSGMNYTWTDQRVFGWCSSLTRVVFEGLPPDGFAYSGLGNPPSGYADGWVAPVSYKRQYGSQWAKFVTLDKFAGFVEDEGLDAIVTDSKIRENDPSVMDVVYKVVSKKPTVKVRVLAFEDGTRSFAKVVRPETFVDGTEVNVGDSIAANVEHKISWRVSGDWKTKLAKVKFEVLAREGELLPLETMTIPASDQYGKMKFTWNTHTGNQVLDALLWLYADKDPGLVLTYGVLKNGTTQLASGASVSADNAMRYIYSKMGYSLLTGAPLTYANQETRLGLSPSGARQYGYKIVE